VMTPHGRRARRTPRLSNGWKQTQYPGVSWFRAAAWVTMSGPLQVQARRWSAAEAYPLRGKEAYILGDLFDPGAVQGRFDWVFEHTFFCAIRPERRGDYVRRVTALLKPGGCLLAIFFLDPDHDEEGPPYGCRVEELDALFSARFRLVSERGDLPTYPGREGRELLRLLVRN
jgi:methyl halide transferase